MKSTTRYSFFLFLVLILVGCVPDTSKNKNVKNIKKIESRGNLKYFKDRYEQEIYSPIDKQHGFYITLPECFEFRPYSSFSLKNQFTYICDKHATFISVDHISKEEISYYKDYFENKKTKSQSNLNILRDYIMEIRFVGLNEAQKSVYSTSRTYNNKTMLLGTVMGKVSTYDDELSYQFGVIAIDDTYYVLQAISEVNNFKYLRRDIIEIFKSFRAS